MRLLLRRSFILLLHTAALLALLLAALLSALVAAFWVRSYFVGDTAFLYTHHYLSSSTALSPQYHLSIARGSLVFTFRDITDHLSPSFEYDRITATRPAWRPPDPPNQWSWRTESAPCPLHIRGWGVTEWAGFAWYRGPESGAGISGTMYTILLPLWFLLLMTLLPTPLAVHLYRRRRQTQRLQHGLCPTCHYDLRAHHPGDRCPECGTPIPQTPAAPSSS